MSTDRGRALVEWAELWRRREPDLLVHDPGGPRECLVRAGQLVVAADSVGPAMRALDRWVERVELTEEAKLATLRLRPSAGRRCVELALDAGGPAAANHVHVGCPLLLGTPILHGTAAAPGPAAEPPPPPLEHWSPPVTVAVLDTGLDPHPWFAGRTWLSDWDLQPEILDADGDRESDRQAGHGTFVAGIVLRYAPGATIRHRRVLTSQGLTDDRTLAAALRAVRHQAARRGEHLDVVLLTAGCHTADDRCPPLLAREISRFTDAAVVAAAGNGATTRPFWPAALPEVMAVAATNGQPGSLAPFSNRGPWVDAAAPGVDIVSSFVRFHPPERGQAHDTETRRYGAASWSGTSFAAPRLAAVIATLLHTGRTLPEAHQQTRDRFPPP
ncbi:MAG TPA: S8/S53 family peptidase [Actinophytocola sp.]|uniref:S8 family peptidase n=1 Tax=Actinophytocola sp. TaxID=1872138 RepID=UPI002DDD35D4|nr:S8/S53 family peptidase [Actinophytocola sp.]HEV2783061.1 S8/S53 family peptidase [Actinophytocola sp.]